MEEKATENKKNYHRRRRKKPQNAGTNKTSKVGEKAQQAQQTQHAKPQHVSNGGYTNQIANRKKQGNENPNRERKGQGSRKKRGYQPDTGKDAIRAFDLGMYTEGDDLYLFTFDRGTYRILKGKVPEETETAPEEELPEGEEGAENAEEKPYLPVAGFDREAAEELLLTRDKMQAYQSWNEIKRPKTKKREKEQSSEQKDAS